MEKENRVFAPLPLLHHHCTAIIFDFQNVITVFSYKFLFLNAIWMFLNFEYLLLANTIVHLKHYCFSTIWIGVFFIMSKSLCFFFKNLLLLTLINRLMQMLLLKVVPPNKYSPKIQKFIQKIYLWVNSFLTKMQLFSMQLDFHRENKIHKMLFQVSFKNFPEAFKNQIFLQNSSWWLLGYIASISCLHMLYVKVRNFCEWKVSQVLRILNSFLKIRYSNMTFKNGKINFW